MEMAERRGTSISTQGLIVYGEDLEPFELEDIRATCLKIGRTEPEEFEPKLPLSGTLIKAVQRTERRRKERIRPEQLRPEVRDAFLVSTGQKALSSPAEEMVPFDMNAEVRARLGDGKMAMPDVPVQKIIVPLEPEPPRPCVHCGNESSPKASKSLFHLADYYKHKAELAAEREQVEAAKLDEAANISVEPAKV